MSAARVEPMLATLTDRLPPPGSCPGGCRYEPKWNGFRALAEVDEYQDVSLTSRRSKPLTAALPEITSAAYDMVPVRIIVNGVIIR